MTTIAPNPKARPTSTPSWPGMRFVIVWPCTAMTATTVSLQRRRFMLRVRPLDEHQAHIEAWMECDGLPPRPIFGPHCRPCRIAEIGTMLHIDASEDQHRLLALTFANVHGGATLVYAHSSLLSRAGLASGAFDAPMLCSVH